MLGIPEDTATADDVTVRVNPLARLRADSHGQWLAALIGSRVGHRVDKWAATALVKAATPITRKQLIDALDGYGQSATAAARLVGWLIEHAYLVTSDERGALAMGHELRRWRQAGWGGAGTYHFATYAYLFEHYGPGGKSAEDMRRMRAYSRVQADRERAISLGARNGSVRQLPRPTAELIGTGDAPGLTAGTLSVLLTLLGCPVGEAYPPWPGAAKVMLKTTPSGGCRHPTEIYVLSSAIDDVADGWHHVDALGCRLEEVRRAADPDGQLKRALPEAFVPGGSWALIVYTSVFARNRYRYREPRTFRTIHMDVGHLMTTCAYLARALSMASLPFSHPAVGALAEMLELDQLIEAPIAATLLCEDPRDDS